jgi:Cys-rich protein (TIGR01571 family)
MADVPSAPKSLEIPTAIAVSDLEVGILQPSPQQPGQALPPQQLYPQYPPQLYPQQLPPQQLSPQQYAALQQQQVLNGGSPQAQPVYICMPPMQPAQQQSAEPPMMGSWMVGLCGCFQDLIPNCCMSVLCPCVSTAQIAKRLGVSSCCCGFCLSILFLWCGLFPFWVCHLRGTTRRRFRIPGNCCGDCCESFCCTCCAIAQMATRAGSYKPGSCSFTSLDTLPPYKPM